MFYSKICGCISSKSAGWTLTHGWSSQRLSSNQLGGAKTIQEVAELCIGGESNSREDEAKAKGHESLCLYELTLTESGGQMNPMKCLLTFPLSCSCSCCRPWTPGSPGGSSCFASPPPGPSPCSSGSCYAISCLLLLVARSEPQNWERERDTHKMMHGWSNAPNRRVRLSQNPVTGRANPGGVKETTPKPLNHSSPQCAPQRPTLCTEENVHGPFL